MNKTLLISGLFVAAAFVSQPALAEVKFRVGKSNSDYELSGDYTKAKSSYSPTTFGVTFSSNSATDAGYLDLSYSSGSGHHDGWATANVNSTVCGGSCGNSASPSNEFKRSDFALTGGVVFMNQNSGVAGNVYMGLKTGSTKLGAEHVTWMISGLGWTEETFDTAGLVFGGGVSFPIAGGKAGSFGVTAGLGIMGATWKDSTGWSAKSDSAVGGSFGASYTFPFTPNFGVTAEYKYNSYSYTFKFNGNSQFTVDEKVSSLGALIYAKF
jgi:hypothetical protein